MLYHSTRGSNKEERLHSFLNVLLKGLASDGGLFVPTSYSSLVIEERLWRFLSYQELAFRLFRWFISDVPYSTIRKIVRSVYNERSPLSYYSRQTTSCPVGVSPIANAPIYMLHLSNGPSLSFKDIAMQLLCTFFEYILGRSSVNIISATSGDTGSSVCTAFQFCKRSSLFVFSPLKSISEYQAEQMYNHLSKKAFNICFNGKFDCCQDIVKILLCRNRSNSGTANSINWSRLLFQTAYYFISYFRVTIEPKEKATFLIPSGNFGNAFAGFISRAMGLPIRRIIIATNENNVLEEFFKTGSYQVRKATSLLSTNTPSTDISKASNLERLFLEILNRNSSIVLKVFQQLQQLGFVCLLSYVSYRSIKRLGITAESAFDSERQMIIQYFYKRSGLLIDTHTSNGAKAVLLLKHSKTIRDVKIILETAQALKLKDTLQAMIGSNYIFLTQRRTRRLRVMFPCVAHVKQFMVLKAGLLEDRY